MISQQSSLFVKTKVANINKTFLKCFGLADEDINYKIEFMISDS